MVQETRRAPTVIILAAGIGSRLSPLTDDTHKCLLQVGKSTILERMIRNCLSCGISQYILVLGHREDDIRTFVNKTFRGIRVTYIVNNRYRETNTAYSLMLASESIGRTEFIKFDADVVFDTKILRNLLDSDHPNALCIDRNIALDMEEVKVITDDKGQVLQVGKSVDPKLALGESIGIEKISAETARLLFEELSLMLNNEAHAQEYYEAAYERLIDRAIPFHAIDITGLNWTEIDTAADYATAEAIFETPAKTISRSQQKVLDAKTDDNK